MKPLNLKTIFVTFGILISLSVPGMSQTNSPKTEEVKARFAPNETIAVIPWSFRKGSDGSKKTAKAFISNLASKLKMDQISDAKVRLAVDEDNSSSHLVKKSQLSGIPEGYTMLYPNVLEDDTDPDTLATPSQMLRIGQKFGVDWVMTGNAEWHSRSIWVGFGPKTKSTCTINARVVDVKNKEVVLDVQNIQVDSTAKEDTMKVIGTLFVSNLFTIVSGGPKTPHEERSVQLGILKALEPWIAQHKKITKIDTEVE